ncbi:MAG: HNH endonuclease, partial [Halofilum sp. (in: g-proteobacteria)]
MAYEWRCCLCGYDIRLDTTVIGLEAAHIMWFQAGGPDVESNGLALCVLHHKIFDLGAFTIAPDKLEVQFSRHMMGSSEIQSRLLAYQGASLL